MSFDFLVGWMTQPTIQQQAANASKSLPYGLVLEMIHIKKEAVDSLLSFSHYFVKTSY
jgi:hypothetical protein